MDASVTADERQPRLGEEELAALEHGCGLVRCTMPRLIAALRASRAEVERLWGERVENGYYRYICEAGHRTVTTADEYPVCTAVLPIAGTVPGLPCGAAVEYRIVTYTPVIAGDGLGVAQEEEG